MPNPTQITPFEVWTVDIETNDLAGATIWTSWCDASGLAAGKAMSLTDFLLTHFLLPENDGALCYAHNAMRFDLQRIDFAALVDAGFAGTMPSRGAGAVVEVVITKTLPREKGQRTSRVLMWKLRDSFSLCPVSLAAFTKQYAPLEQKMRRVGFDKRPFNIESKYDQRYAIRDARALWVALQELNRQMEPVLGCPIFSRASISGLAMAGLQARAGYMELVRNSAHGRYITPIRSSYHGGIVFAKTSGVIHEDIVALDFNAHYPTQAVVHSMPAGKAMLLSKPSRMIKGNALYLATVTIAADAYPVLRSLGADGKYGALAGTVKGWYWGVELLEQLRLGAVLDALDEAIVWPETSDVLKAYIADLLALRSNAKATGAPDLGFKLCASSVYGKLGQRSEGEVLGFGSEFPEEALMILDGYGDIMQDVYTLNLDINARVALPHWASYITALARVALTSAISDFNRVLYSDTDSLFIKKEDLALVTQEAIAGTKVDKVCRYFIPIAPKVYAWMSEDGIWEIKAKGLGRAIPKIRKNTAPEKVRDLLVAGIVAPVGMVPALGRRLSKRDLPFYTLLNRTTTKAENIRDGYYDELNTWRPDTQVGVELPELTGYTKYVAPVKKAKAKKK